VEGGIARLVFEGEARDALLGVFVEGWVPRTLEYLLRSEASEHEERTRRGESVEIGILLASVLCSLIAPAEPPKLGHAGRSSNDARNATHGVVGGRITHTHAHRSGSQTACHIHTERSGVRLPLSTAPLPLPQVGERAPSRSATSSALPTLGRKRRWSVDCFCCDCASGGGRRGRASAKWVREAAEGGSAEQARARERKNQNAWYAIVVDGALGKQLVMR